MHAFRFLMLTAAVALALPALAQQIPQGKPVPGEKWKQSVQMDMGGMKIPTQNFEVCVPIGKADEALSRPPNNPNCELKNAQRSGNRFSADLHCTGKQAMDGHIESTIDGNHTVTRMQMQMQGMSAVMNLDATKIGTACEAKDYSGVAAELKKSPATTQTADVCAQVSDRFTRNPRDLAGAVPMYAEPNGSCARSASMKNFCAAVQTPAGYSSLSTQERSLAKSATAKNASSTPLTSALTACNLGTADSLRTKLLATAEKDNSWDFLVAEGNDSTMAMLTATARRECAGRSFTNAPASRYAALCSKYGVALARGDKAAAKSAAGVMSDAPGGGAAPPAASGPAEGAEQEAQKSKTRDALDKGKKKLKSLFGGGAD